MKKLLIRTIGFEPPFAPDLADPTAHWLIDENDELDDAKERNPVFFSCRHGYEEHVEVYRGFILATNTRDLGKRQITSTQIYVLDKMPGRTMYCCTVDNQGEAVAIINRLWAHPSGLLFEDLTKPVYVGTPKEAEAACCEDWKPQLEILNGFITLQAARSGNPAIYNGIPFRFCPWCGAKVKENEGT